jgi:hypothetical protein
VIPTSSAEVPDTDPDFDEYQALFAESVHRAMEQVENARSQQKMIV